MRTKTFLLLLCLHFSVLSNGQKLCGHFFENYDTGEDMYYDRFDNSYVAESSSSGTSSITTSFFDLNFNNNVPANIQDLVELVFEDLEALLSISQHTYPCGDILPLGMPLVRIEYEDEGDTYLAAATPFFTKLNNGGCTVINQNILLQQLTTGTSNANAGSSGRIRINSFFMNDFFMATSDTDPCPADKYDLYTVLLHEIGHLLGFAGRSDEEVNYYDTHLELNGTAVADNDCGLCYSKIPRAQIEPVLASNPCNVTIDGFPVSGPPAGEDITEDGIYANAISHLSGTCGGGSTDYVMNPDLDLGEEKREFTEDEKGIFCTLGLEFTGCATNRIFVRYESIKSDIKSQNFNDISCCSKIESVCGGETLTLFSEDLLCNDFGEDIIILDASVNPLFGSIEIIDGDIQFTPEIDVYRDVRITYYVHNAVSCETMASIVDVNIAFCPECEPNGECNGLLCIESFEDLPDYTSINGSTSKYGIGEIYFDHNTSGRPLDNSPDFCFNDNNNFIMLGDFQVSTGPETFGLPLEYGIYPNEQVIISIELAGSNSQSGVQLYGSDLVICNPIEQLIPLDFCGDPMTCSGISVETQCISEDEIIVNNPINVVGNQRCNIDKSDFEWHDIVWTNTSESIVNFIYFEANNDWVAISDILINKIPDFQVERLDCATYKFTYPNFSGEVEVTSWEIESGPIITPGGNTVTFGFALEGSYEVCMNLLCVNEPYQVCKEIEVGDPWDEDGDGVFIACELCQNPDVAEVEARRCDDTSNEFFVEDFDIIIPKGYGPCREDDFYVQAINGTVATNGYSITTSNSDFDILHVSFDFFAIDPDLGMGGFIALCNEDGTSATCTSFRIITAETCETCHEIVLDSSSDAICDDSNPYDDISEYSGTVTLPLIVFDAFCGATSSVGVNFGDPYPSGNQTISLDYTFSVNADDELDEGLEIMLCFDDSGDEICFTFVINVPEPCPRPIDCIENHTFSADCSTTSDGQAFFSLQVSSFIVSIQGLGMEVCDDVLLEGGTMIMNTLEIFQQTDYLLIGNIQFSVDCESILGGTFTTDLTVPLCNSQGMEECFTITLQLTCEECKDDDKDKSGPRMDKVFVSDEHIKLYPNPTSNIVNIEIPSYANNRSYDLVLSDRFGRKLTSMVAVSKISELNLENIVPGMHFLRIYKNGILLDIQKLVVVK